MIHIHNKGYEISNIVHLGKNKFDIRYYISEHNFFQIHFNGIFEYINGDVCEQEIMCWNS